MTVASGGSVTLNDDDAKIYSPAITVKNGGKMTLATKESFVFAEEMDVEPGGELVIRGFLSWDNISLQGTTVFRIADTPDTDNFGVSDGTGTAVVQGTIRTELVEGFVPSEDDILIYDLILSSDINGPIGTEEKPGEDWEYSFQDDVLKITYAPGALPVEWLDFTGQWLGKQAQLNWQTASERGSSHFDVERRNEAGNWLKVGEVAARGETTSTNSYDFLDVNPGPTNPILYRLRQVDQDGDFSYSSIVSLERDGDGAVSLFPNPARGHIFVEGLSPGAFRITDAAGRQVAQGRINDANRFRIDLPQTLPVGTYFLRGETGAALRFTVTQ